MMPEYKTIKEIAKKGKLYNCSLAIIDSQCGESLQNPLHWMAEAEITLSCSCCTTQTAGLNSRSISSSDRPFVSTTLPAIYMTARRQTDANPRYTVLIPNLVTTLKKYRPIKKFIICSRRNTRQYQ